MPYPEPIWPYCISKRATPPFQVQFIQKTGSLKFWLDRLRPEYWNMTALWQWPHVSWEWHASCLPPDLPISIIAIFWPTFTSTTTTRKVSTIPQFRFLKLLPRKVQGPIQAVIRNQNFPQSTWIYTQKLSKVMLPISYGTCWITMAVFNIFLLKK